MTGNGTRRSRRGTRRDPHRGRHRDVHQQFAVGHRPTTGTVGVHRPHSPPGDPKAVAGYDLTPLPRRRSRPVGGAPREVAEQIEAAHDAAIADTVKYLEREVAYTREGAPAPARSTSPAGRPPRSRTATRAPVTPICTPTSRSAIRCRPVAGRVARARRPSRVQGHRLGVRALQHPDGSRARRSGSGSLRRPARRRHAQAAVREIVGVDARLERFWSSRRVGIDRRRAELTAPVPGRARPSADRRRGAAPGSAGHLGDPRRQSTNPVASPSSGKPGVSKHSASWGATASPGMVRNARSATAAPQQAVTPEWVADTAGRRPQPRVHRPRDLAGVARARRSPPTGTRRRHPPGRTRPAVERVVDAALSPAASIRLGVQDPVAEPAALRRADGRRSTPSPARPAVHVQRRGRGRTVLVDAAQRHDGRVLADRDVDLALLDRPPTASPSTTCKRRWSANSAPQVPGPRSRSPQPDRQDHRDAHPVPGVVEQRWQRHRAAPPQPSPRPGYEPRYRPRLTRWPTSTRSTPATAQVGAPHRFLNPGRHRRGRHGRDPRPGPRRGYVLEPRRVASGSSATTNNWPRSPPAGCYATSPTPPASSPSASSCASRTPPRRGHPGPVAGDSNTVL